MASQILKTITVCIASTLFGGLLSTANAKGTQPSFDCSKAQSSAEELICADDKLASLDRRLAQRFGAALETVQSLDVGSEDAEKTLRATQRGWIKGRDECWKADNLRDCVMSAYLTRENELVTRWMLQSPASTVSYFCDGNRANEITAMFFDTELPSVRLEYGDSIDSGSLVRTASGSRYEATFGRSIWIKGSEAIVVWPEGNEMSCAKVE